MHITKPDIKFLSIDRKLMLELKQVRAINAIFKPLVYELSFMSEKLRKQAFKYQSCRNFHPI